MLLFINLKIKIVENRNSIENNKWYRIFCLRKKIRIVFIVDT